MKSKPRSSSGKPKVDVDEKAGSKSSISKWPRVDDNSQSFKGSLLATPRSKNEKLTRTNYREDVDEDDEGEAFARNLNGIILQYLESCGLTETYTTFYDECKSSGMLIPSQFRAEIERGISFQDVETLLMHFDQENGDALLELWGVLLNMVDNSQHSHEVEKITFYIQIYIALIPFRKKMTEETKSQSMQKLREYFETRSNACTMDKEMLTFFALPFVPDPEKHPIFGNLFQAAWVKKLRSRIKNLARALCSPNKLTTRESTDLAKMFIECSKAIPHEIESLDGKKICVLSNSRPVDFTSGVMRPSSSSTREYADEFNPSQLFQRLNDLVLENERYKVEESKYEKQCAQLLNVSLLLAQSLEEAAQGQEVNMNKLRYEVNNCLPMAMQKENHPVKLFREPKSSSGNASSCYESDVSSPNNLVDENDDEARKDESRESPKPE